MEKLDNNTQLIRNYSENRIFDELFFTFHSCIIATKHPGFTEEREWRLFYSPDIYTHSNQTSDSHNQISLTPSIKEISGVPQKLYKLNFSKMEIKKLIHKVIIGPTQFSDTIKTALQEEFGEIFYNRNMILSSDIPLRR